MIGAGTRDGATMTYQFELAIGERRMRWSDVHEAVDANTRRFRSIIELPTGEPHEVVSALYRRR